MFTASDEAMLMKRHEPLVKYTLRRASLLSIAYVLERDDALQIGRMALLEAIRTFRSGRAPFPLYAYIVIRRDLLAAASKHLHSRPIKQCPLLEVERHYPVSERQSGFVQIRDLLTNIHASAIDEMDMDIIRELCESGERLSVKQCREIGKGYGVSFEVVRLRLRRLLSIGIGMDDEEYPAFVMTKRAKVH